MFAQPRHDRRRFLGMVAISLGAAWIGTRDSVIHMITVTPFRPSSASDLASLGGATAWLNSPPLTAADLQGKVVLVAFWTYTCRVNLTQDRRPLRRYKRRWKVERLFAWLQNSRRLVTRYERRAANFTGFLHLACAMILLRHL